jgi:DNA-binding GntR family transcriptional regulator
LRTVPPLQSRYDEPRFSGILGSFRRGSRRGGNPVPEECGMATGHDTFMTPSSRNIGESVYLALRKNIVNLNLAPGEPLNVRDVAAKLKVSRTPVREALIKLGKEGLVDVYPQKGTIVSRIDLGRVEEERFIRWSLEEKVLGLFVNLHGPDEETALREAILRQHESLDKSDYLAFLVHDDEFHRIFFITAGKPMSWEIIRSMSGHYRRVRLMSLWDDQVVRDVIGEHEAILESVVRGDAAQAAERAKEHLSRISAVEQTLMKKFPHYFKHNESDDSLVKDFLDLS